jgi:hypothetical protein
MKTPEDEAFEDIERRQGGGFKAKQAMVANKLLEPVECLDCGSNNVGILATYDSLVNSVKSQPEQEPPRLQMMPMQGEDGTQGWFINGPNFYCDIERKPGEQYSLFIRSKDDGVEGYAEMTPPLPAQREWVGLTLDEIEELFQIAAGADEETDIRFARLIEAKLKEKNFD